MKINITRHTLARARQRMGWNPSEAIQRAKKIIEEFLEKNPSVVSFDDEFTVTDNLAEWVVVKDDEENYTVVTIKYRHL